MYDLGNAVAQAFYMTTQEQRRNVNTSPELRFTYADLLKIDSDALLLASYLENEHPSVCNGSIPKSKDWYTLLKLALTHRPVDRQTKTVDKSLKSVEKPVKKPVDNL